MGQQHMQKRILLLSEAFGAGHTMAAEAIKEGAQLLQPEWDFKVIELGSWLHPTLSQWISGLYMGTIKYSPSLWGVIYRNGRSRPVKPPTEFFLHKLIYRQVMTLLQSYKPDMIVCTHPFPAAVISRLKRLHLIHIPLYTVITDYGIHGSWISSSVDRYLVPSDGVKDQMEKLGVPSIRIQVTGIPIRPSFWEKRKKSEIRDKLGLIDLPTVLIMGGGLGVGLSESMLRLLNNYKDKLQLLFVTGRNKTLYDDLQVNSHLQHRNIHVYPFIDYIDQLMDAADLLITKPGGVTCTEAMHKGIPMILLDPIPGQEEENLIYMIENHFGTFAGHVENTKKLLDQLLLPQQKTMNHPQTPLPNPAGRRAVEELVFGVS